MLTDTQQSEIRRILGYPAIGRPNASYPSVASMFSAFKLIDPTGALETRLQGLQVYEEVQIFGQEHTSFALYPQPFGESYTPSDGSAVVYGFVPIIRIFQSDLTGARDFASFEKADVVSFSPLEAARRRSLLREKRRQLADYLVVPLDPDVANNSGGSRSHRRR
jgi:hypothetical protein